jgi:hypothetical protein
VQVSPQSRFPDLLEKAKEQHFESLNLQKRKQLIEDLFNDFFIHLAKTPATKILSIFLDATSEAVARRVMTRCQSTGPLKIKWFNFPSRSLFNAQLSLIVSANRSIKSKLFIY